jgi:Spy/CpxP family protein refolding chaperone
MTLEAAVKIHRRPTIAMLVTALVATATGCGGTADEPITPAGATRAPVALQANERLRRIGEAFGEVALLPAQRAEIDKLAADTDARHANVASIRQALASAVAAQVAVGSIDRAALDPKVAAFADAWAKARAADAAAVERLHAILDIDQRTDLVDALRGGLSTGRRGKGERLMELATELALTPDQIAKVTQVMEQRRAERRAHKKDGVRGKRQRFEGMLEAFASDDFSLQDMPAGDELNAKAQRRAERLLGTIEAVLPILTPAQRKLAAAKLETLARDAAF